MHGDVECDEDEEERKDDLEEAIGHEDLEEAFRRSMRIQKCRSAKLEAKNQKAKENARGRARRAARSNKPYNPPNARLKEIAAQAYAAEVTATSGVKKAEGAHEAADEAKKEAANARVMAFRNSKHIATLQNVGKTVMETLIETAARAKRNEERLESKSLRTDQNQIAAALRKFGYPEEGDEETISFTALAAEEEAAAFAAEELEGSHQVIQAQNRSTNLPEDS